MFACNFTGCRVAAVASVLLLAGCSDEPSAANIKEAITKHPKTRLGFELSKGLNPGMPQQFEAAMDALRIEKNNCVKATNAPGYVCDLRVGIPMGGKVDFGPWGKIRVFKTESGWATDDVP